MDVEDVSGIERFMGILMNQKAVLRKADERKGEKPSDRKTLNQLIARHMACYADMASRNVGNPGMIHLSFVAPPYLPSVAPSEELEKVYLKDLRLQTHHRGSYILLRAVTPAFSMTAVMATMEDEMGEGVTLQLYHQEEQHDRSAKDIIKIKSVCIIKEPYYKIMNDGGYGVRIDHVSDIIWLSPGDRRVPLGWRPKLEEIKEASALKQEGNEAIKCGRTHVAVELYTQALSLTGADEESRIIRLNRSLAHLKLGLYENAIEDAGDLYNNAQLAEKSLYRAASAMSGLRRFKECRGTLQKLLANYPDCRPAKLEMTRMERLYSEEEHGDYDYRAMYQAAQNTPPFLDNGTYIGSAVVQDSNGRGRGLFATRDVAPGELLLCEKAFAYCFAANEAGEDSTEVTSRTAVLMNTHNNRASIGAQADLLASLYHGDYVPVKENCVDAIPIVDTFLIERIMSLNVFGCPRTSLRTHFHKKQASDPYHTCGIFITASYVNHSCHGNARRSFIGDMQIIRAAGSIPAGTEITFSYIALEPNDTHDNIQTKLANWGFRCTCISCLEIRRTKKSILDKRLGLYERLRAIFNSKTGVDILKVERLLLALEKTYTNPTTKVPRLALSDPYFALTRLYTQGNKLAHAITYAWKALTSLGFVIKREQQASLTSKFEIEQWGLVADDVIGIWVHLWVAYSVLAPELCGKCAEYARVSYKICIGEDETFDEHYGRAAKEAITNGASLLHEMKKMKI